MAEMPKPRRRWFRFSLRVLLIVAMLVSALIGVRVKTVRDFDRAVARLQGRGFTVFIFRHVGNAPTLSLGKFPDARPYWKRILAGEGKISSSVEAREFGEQVSDNDIRASLGDFQIIGPLISMRLQGSRITDKSLRKFESLPLEWLWLHDTSVTDAGVAKLQTALPACKIQAWKSPKEPWIKFPISPNDFSGRLKGANNGTLTGPLDPVD